MALTPQDQAALNIPQGARHAPATLRNREVILAALRKVFGQNARILEIAAGSGEHGVYFTTRNPGWRWEPTDCDAGAVSSIAAWSAQIGTIAAPPRLLDVCDHAWHEPPLADALYDGVFCANMIHIAPPDATQGLLRTASAQLKPGGSLAVYGPFMAGGGHTAPSNEAFDMSLKSRDSRWGIRALDAIVELARSHALVHQKTYAMPANNLCLHFTKSDAAPFKLPAP